MGDNRHEFLHLAFRVLVNLCELVKSVSKPIVFRRFPMASEHQLLFLMQRILAFRASFVDTGRAFVKFPTLYFGGIPRAKLKAQLF